MTLTKLIQYTEVPTDMLIDYPQLDVRAILAWSLIYDRYRSSQGRKGFYDKKVGDYYAVYPNEELSIKLHKHVDTITGYLKQLRAVGLLVSKKCFNGVLKLFPMLPDKYKAQTPPVHQTEFSMVTQPANIGFNHFIFSHLVCATSDSNNTKTPAPESEPADTSASNQKNEDPVQAIKALSSTFETKWGINPKSVAVMQKYAKNDVERLHTFGGALLKAKKHINKDITAQGFPEMHFEDNLIQLTLHQNLERILAYCVKTATSENHLRALLTVCLTGYFQDIADATMMTNDPRSARLTLTDQRIKLLAYNYGLGYEIMDNALRGEKRW